MIDLRIGGVTKTFDCKINVSRKYTEYSYEDIQTGEEDVHIVGHKLIFDLSSFEQILAIEDINFLKKFKFGLGEIRFNAMLIDESIQAFWFPVKMDGAGISESVIVNSKNENDIYEYLAIGSIKLKTTKYIEDIDFQGFLKVL